MTRKVLGALVALALAPIAVAEAAVAPQPPLDESKLKYEPIGFFKPGETLLPAATGCQDTLQKLRKGEVFNPSGTFNAFDNNVFETLCYPFRGPGDTTDNDPVGNKGAANHGFCGQPYDGSVYGDEVVVAGICDNHQLEWIRYYRETMLEILGDFGASFHQYEFDVEDPGPVQSNTRFGKGRNPAIVIPGADNPDETIVVGAHYDKTNDGPAAAWDSQEGHAEMVREAKIMADYWKATGTRPSATVKFIPWDAEESGTFGSLDYAENNIVPGQESKVRGYWNQDPCAGGYPSFRFGNPADRIRMGVQFADPGAIAGATAEDAARITAFNQRGPKVIQDTLDRIDDTVPTLSGPVETFRSDGEGDGDVGKSGGIAIGTDRPVLFSSDWRNFEVLGIPFFNPGPEVTGPNQESNGDPNFGIDQSADALYSFHTPLDNLQQMFRYTSPDVTGNTYSESWAKGMEFCAQMLSWGMLQHDQGGAQTASTKEPVAYYEALPNEAKEDQAVSFDATASHQLADIASRAKVPADQLELRWDFGDGETGTGVNVKHAYSQVGRYNSKLTVVNKRTGAQDTMEVPITVEPNDVAPPALKKPAEKDDDGTFGLEFDYPGDKKDLKGFVVEESADATTSLNEDAATLDRWKVDAPTEGSGLQPWQGSTSETPKYRGAYPRSAPAAFWTGVTNGQQGYGSQPSEGASIMTLKEPIQIGRGNVSLSYASTFVNGSQDKGRVQVAIDTAGQGDLVWETVDTVTVGSEDSDSLSVFEEAQGDDSSTPYETRVVDLSRFARRKVFVRFGMALGAPDPLPFYSARTGWYVDDIKIGSGQFKPIGETTQGTFTVAERKKGSYAYRVKAMFADGIRSSASNSEPVEVTVGAASAAPSCTATAAFARRTVKPRGKGLRVDVATNAGTVPSVEVYRARGNGLKRLRTTKKAGTFAVPGLTRLASGFYVVKLRSSKEVRSFVFERRGGRFVTRPAFQRTDGCGLLGAFRLSSPVLSGASPLRVQLRTTQPAKVSVAVFRGSSKKAVKRFASRTLRAGRLTKLAMSTKKLRKGGYRVVVTAAAGKEKVTATLRTQRR